VKKRGYIMTVTIKRAETMVEKTMDFIDYVQDFYGEGGIYDMGATFADIMVSTQILFAENPWDSICYDTVDREKVRDILIERFGYVFPEAPIKINLKSS
tara:strand:- start:913 stop:1209 length:297 start_codon:yes stop_codon:yes gene_type:complete